MGGAADGEEVGRVAVGGAELVEAFAEGADEGGVETGDFLGGEVEGGQEVVDDVLLHGVTVSWSM